MGYTGHKPPISTPKTPPTKITVCVRTENFLRQVTLALAKLGDVEAASQTKRPQNCYNCGAPPKSKAQENCEYCGSLLSN